MKLMLHGNTIAVSQLRILLVKSNKENKQLQSQQDLTLSNQVKKRNSIMMIQRLKLKGWTLIQKLMNLALKMKLKNQKKKFQKQNQNPQKLKKKFSRRSQRFQRKKNLKKKLGKMIKESQDIKVKLVQQRKNLLRWKQKTYYKRI